MLEFDGLHKSYGSNHVLDGVGFAVAPGSMFGFCGANGAGKTTTMRIAMGLARADAGEVRWRDRALDDDVRRRIGYMPEERGLYPKQKVGSLFLYYAQNALLGDEVGSGKTRQIISALELRNAYPAIIVAQVGPQL